MSITDDIKEIKKCLSLIEQSTLFCSDDKYKALTESCCNYLKNIGYKVIKPEKPKFVANNTQDLKNFFNACYDRYIDSRYRPGTNTKKQLGLFKKLLDGRMNENISKSSALEECLLIIETIFKYKDEFKFKYISPEIVAMDWVVNKAVGIINREQDKNSEKEYERRMREYLKNTEDDYDHTSILDKLNKMGG